MKRGYGARRGLAFILALAVMLAVPAVAFATDMAVTADTTSVKVGDKVTVTVVVSAEHVAVANGVFTYDPALLSFVSGSGGAADGHINMVSAQSGGSDSLTAVISFTAVKNGEAEIAVSMNSILGYDGQPLETAQAGVSVSIAPADAAGQPGDVEATPPVSLSETGVPAENVLGTTVPMYVWRSLSSLTLPSGFADRQVQYGGEYVNGAAVADSEDIILLYLSDEAGDNGGYYIYSAEKNTLYPYVTLTSVLAEFTLLWPEESIQPPVGFEQATIVWKEREMPAWQAPGTEDTYLVYARNAAGETGFYLYNIEDKSVQRYMAQPAPSQDGTEEPAVSPQVPQNVPVEAENSGAGIMLALPVFITLCVVGVVIAAAVVVLAVLYTRGNRPGVSRKIRVKDTTGQDAEM